MADSEYVMRLETMIADLTAKLAKAEKKAWSAECNYDMLNCKVGELEAELSRYKDAPVGELVKELLTAPDLWVSTADKLAGFMGRGKRAADALTAKDARITEMKVNVRCAIPCLTGLPQDKNIQEALDWLYKAIAANSESGVSDAA